jgi:hypothetical protein
MPIIMTVYCSLVPPIMVYNRAGKHVDQGLSVDHE